MSKKTPYQIDEIFKQAARWGYRALKSAASSTAIPDVKDDYRIDYIGMAQHYHRMAEAPKPEIIRLFLAAPAIRGTTPENRGLIFGADVNTLYAEVDAYQNGENKPLSPMAAEVVEALRTYNVYLEALEDGETFNEDDDDEPVAPSAYPAAKLLLH